MSVEFDEQQFTPTTALAPSTVSGTGFITALFLKMGIVKNATQAGVLMVILSILSFALAIFILIYFVL